jgi:hypothetical protein
MNICDDDFFSISRDSSFPDIIIGSDMNSSSSTENLTQLSCDEYIGFTGKSEPLSNKADDQSYDSSENQKKETETNEDVAPSSTNNKPVNKFKQKKHFSGKIDCSKYQENSRERAKSKLVRRNTIFKKAKEISTLCNVEVAVIFLDNKGVKTYFSNENLENKLQPVLDDALKSDIVTKKNNKL